MKVAHLVCTYPPYSGGMGNSAFHLTHSLNQAGCETAVITPLYGPLSTASESAKRLRPFFKFGNAAVLPQLFWELKHYDLVHLHYPFYGSHLSALLACLVWRKPLVLHYHMDTDAPGLRGLIFKLNRLFIEPLLLRHAKAIIGSSLDYLENSYIADYVNKHSDKVSGIPFGVREDLLEPLQGSEKTKTVLFVGGLDQAHYFKGLNILFEAWQHIQNSIDLNGWTLEIVGGGDLENSYRAMCEKLNISDSVNFLGKLIDGDLAAKYRQAGFLVLPSTTRGEAFGLVLIEAMASGTPVIASNLPGVRSVFTDGEHGLLAEPGNVQSLANAMTRLMTDDIFRIKAGQASRAYAEINYSQQQMADRVMDVYRKILTA